MSEDRFATASLTGGPMNAIVKKLGGEDGALRLLPGDMVVAAAEPKKLLEFVTTVNVAALECFTAMDAFKVDTGPKTAVQIAWIGDNFEQNFLRKTEDACEAAELKVHKLLEQSLDPPIITELADNHEITLGQFFSLLQKQGKGEAGPLLVNFYANIAYIRDFNGTLWAVHARWSADRGGWGVVADSVEGPGRWVGGFQVLSR
jgi:hypothetical protein